MEPKGAWFPSADKICMRDVGFGSFARKAKDRPPDQFSMSEISGFITVISESCLRTETVT